MSKEAQEMVKHTSGPWQVVRRPDGHLHDNIMAGEKRVASIGLRTINNKAESKANARLIAAAPTLLTAAQESADTLDEIAEEFGYHNVIMDVIARLRAASAKATGANQ